MKKKNKNGDKVESEHDLEILKAAAQAWHSRSESSRAIDELEAHQQSHRAKPPHTRFRLEAMNSKSVANGSGANWDFKGSLWDSHEIVAVSKRLEAGMVPLDDPFDEGSGRVRTRQRESKNSLRNLFNSTSSVVFLPFLVLVWSRRAS